MDIRVAVLIERENRFLLGQETAPIIYGLWNWQQGKVERNESHEAAALREVAEETGFTIRLKQKLAVISNPFAGTKETHVFLGAVKSGTLRISSAELLDAQWFTKEEILNMPEELAGPWVIDVISKYL